MDRYLILDDSRDKHVEWLARRVQVGNEYIVQNNGKAETRVAEEDYPTVEIAIRLRNAPELQQWCPVGSAQIKQKKQLKPQLAYNRFPLNLHPEQIAHIMAWASAGFPYGTRREEPARSQEQLVIKIFEESGETKVERLPTISFSGYRSTGRYVEFTTDALNRVVPEELGDSYYQALPIEDNAKGDEALIRHWDYLKTSALEDNDYYESA
jgi:hypothetical protein